MEQQDFFEKKINGETSLSYLDEIKESFIDYAMSVITSRALPDIRDGLKPVQRRILFAMHKEGLQANKKFSKCAGIVGEVLKKYHPHGDSAVYDALVRMAQGWVMRCPLVEGQGNFGSIDGDSPAAYRYTEARLDKISEYLMKDIDHDTVDAVDNYNNTDKEPVVLPASFPNLLINGASGIAVGMATNIPPHNMSEVMSALIELVKKPNMKIEELIKYIKGPDFPTAASIVDDDGIRDAYLSGRGTVRIRARVEVEKQKDKKRIVISEIPYGVVKTRITSRIVELIRTKKLEGIVDIRDESTKEGVRIVLDLAKTAPEEFIMEKLYKNTPLDSNFAVNMVALVDGKPKLVNLRQILSVFIEYREEVIRRRTVFELKKAEEKKHILEGFTKVLEKRDRYLKQILPTSKDKSDLKSIIESEFKLSPVQSEALVVLPNYRFSGLESEKIMQEHESLVKEVERLTSILDSDKKIKNIIVKEFTEIRDKFSEERKTSIISNFEDKKLADLIPSKQITVALTDGGFIKRYSSSSDKQQERESKIVFTGDDVVRVARKANMAGRILVFTSEAKVLPLKVFSIPELRRYGKGTELRDFLNTKSELKVVGIFDEQEISELIMLTRKGYLKKINVTEFNNIKNNGAQAFSLRKDDKVVGVERLSEGLSSIAVLDDHFKVLKVDLSKIEPSQKGKAPLNVCDGILDYLMLKDISTDIIFVNGDGNIRQKAGKDKPVGLMSFDSGFEFVAQTNSGRYVSINTDSGVELQKGEKLVRTFPYVEDD